MSGPESVKHGRLQAVIGLVLIAIGLAVLVGWIVMGSTVYNSVPLLGTGIVIAGAVVNRRSSRG